MSRFVKKLVSLPVRQLAEYLANRFLGKFVDNIDLTREGTSFDGEKLTLPDLALKCHVLNESMQHTPLKFIKFEIGTLCLRVLNVRNGQVQISIKDVKIDFEIQSETFQQAQAAAGQGQAQNKPTEGVRNADKKRELFLVDMLLSNVLTNLEMSVENVAIRVVTREAKSADEKVPTFLIRTHAISFSRQEAPKTQQAQAESTPPVDPLLPMSDLQCLLGNKKFAVSDISVHLMREKFLDPFEYCKPGQFSSKFNAGSFPFDYPSLNHPSTILLIKAPFGVNEISSVKTLKLRPDYDFLPSIEAQFDQKEPGHLSCAINFPLAELQVSVGQLKQINQVLQSLNPKRGGATQDEEESKSQRVPQEQTDQNQSQGVDEVKADFAKSNPQLIESMHEIFESQRQEYLKYSSIQESTYQGNASDYIMDESLLRGKGDGVSQQDALKDSVHPDMLSSSNRPFMVDADVHLGYTSCVVADDTHLPVKQPLNLIKVEFTLGKFITTILASEEPEGQELDEGNRDDLSLALEQISDEQGSRREEDPADALVPFESCPFVLEHDRVFKAFGEKVNKDYPMQKFHLPARVKKDTSQIKSEWFEFCIVEVSLQSEIQREKEIVKRVDLYCGIGSILGQRFDAILNVNQSSAPINKGNVNVVNTSVMSDTSLYMDSSSMFMSCKEQGYDSQLMQSLQDSVYHDALDQTGNRLLKQTSNASTSSHQQPQIAISSAANFFVFSQLTNVVNYQTQMGTFHICKNTICEVIKLKNKTKSLEFRLQSKQTGVTKIKTLTCLGKVFANISQSEVLLALAFKQTPSLDQPQSLNKDEDVKIAEKESSENRTEVITQAVIESCELDFNFSISNERTLHILKALTKSRGTVQEALAQVPCTCDCKDNGASIGLNTTRMTFEANPAKKDPCFKLQQADLVARMASSNRFPITLASIKELAVRFPKSTNRNHEEEAKSPGTASSHTLMTIFTGEENQRQSLFQKSSSDPYDQKIEEDERKSYSKRSSQNFKNGVHLIGQSYDPQLSVQVQQVSIVLDHGDLLGPLADHLTSVEGQVKNLLNVIDTVNVVSASKISEREIYFLKKRERIGKPLRINTQVEDITIQLLFKGKEAVKVRMDKTAVDFKMQDRGQVSNFAVGVKLHDFIVVDQIQQVHSYFNIAQLSQQGEPEPPKLYQYPQRNATLEQEVAHCAEFLLVHPSLKSHDRPQVVCDIQISFLNQASMEERITIGDLRSMLSSLKDAGSDTNGSRQIYIDFAEMKKNPAKILIVAALSHIAINVSNQNLDLSQKLSKIAKKGATIFGKHRLKKGLADRENRRLVPRASPEIDRSFDQLEVKTTLRDLTVIYTPVLSRSKLNSAFGVTRGLLEQGHDLDELLYRLSRHVAVHLNNLEMSLAPKEKTIDFRLRSLALHYLTESHPEKYLTWLLQGQKLAGIKTATTSQQELQRRGFVPLIALTDFAMVARAKKISIKLSQVSLSFAEDSLHDIIAFFKLVQVSISDDLVRLEDALDQTVSLEESTTGGITNSNASGNLTRFNSLRTVREDSESLEESKRQMSTGSFAGQDNDSILLASDCDNNNALSNISDHMFTVSVQKPSLQARQTSLVQSTVSQRGVNLLSMLDHDYFQQPQESQSKLEQMRYRKIHILDEQMQHLVCSLSFEFELGSLRLTLFQGKDFAFIKNPQTVKPAQGQKTEMEKLAESAVFANKQGLGQTTAAGGENNLMNPFRVSRVNSQTVHLSQRQMQSVQRNKISTISTKDVKEVMQVEDNYLEQGSLAEDSNLESLSRQRSSHRRHNFYFKLAVQDLIATRRHFPDQACLCEWKANKHETPKRGSKRKTFALSARNFQVTFSHARGTKTLLECPYYLRHHNMIELTVQSEKLYETNTEEHSILLFFRPTKLTVDKDVQDFLLNILTETKEAQQMREFHLRLATNDDDFTVIEESKEDNPSLTNQKDGRSASGDLATNKPQKTTQLIRNLVIKETSLTLSVSLTKVITISFQNATIRIKEFKLKSCAELGHLLRGENVPALPIQKVSEALGKFYKDDILNNQLVTIFKSIRPVQRVAYFGGSILSPIYKPLFRGYQFGLNGMLTGLSEGFGDLYGMLAEGTYEWTIYLVDLGRN